MIKPSAYTKTFWNFLKKKYQFFREKGKLDEDGSFFYDDKRFAKELGCSTRSISRAREFWTNAGFIKYDFIRYRTKATKYWLLKLDNLSTFYSGHKADDLTQKADNLGQKTDNLGQKADILEQKDGQNVTPNTFINKETNKETNKEKPVFDDAHLQYILSFGKNNTDLIKRTLESGGYDQMQIADIMCRNGLEE